MVLSDFIGSYNAEKPIANENQRLFARVFACPLSSMHRLGRGARLCEVAKERGITFKVAEVWMGDRSLERQLKRQKNSRRFCPICNAPQYKYT